MSFHGCDKWRGLTFRQRECGQWRCGRCQRPAVGAGLEPADPGGGGEPVHRCCFAQGGGLTAAASQLHTRGPLSVGRPAQAIRVKERRCMGPSEFARTQKHQRLAGTAT
mmetsp:Transcript_99390/g.252475  ORF Transcript_99390/g.252475 Transcript_99390/m.252475 type:complete len:109 (+) Transcript_99390:698-1024(+)